MPARQTVLETHNISKRFGQVRAVDNVSLSVGRGEIYGFLGLNGAGKTTTIRMLLGMIAPTAGSAMILETLIRRGGRGQWEKIGCIVETPHSYTDLTVRENLEAHRRLRGLNDPDVVGRVMKTLRLDSYADRKARHLSLGNAQRLGLAKALLHDPEILILDEPANGLDPAGIVEMRELLLKLARERSVTIFISSHILGEISRIADRIGIIHQGRLLQESETSDLERSLLRRLVVRTRNNEEASNRLRGAGLDPHIDGDAIVLNDQKSLDAPEHVSSLLAAASVPPFSLVLEEEDLEQYFLRMIREKEANA